MSFPSDPSYSIDEADPIDAGLPSESSPESMPAAPLSSDIRREVGEVSPARAALVKKLTGAVKASKDHFARDYEKMRHNMKFLGGDQWDTGRTGDKYQANIIQRHIQSKVAALFAKNPTAVCRRRKTLDFSIWDESASALISAQTAMQVQAQNSAATGVMQPIDPAASALLADVMQGIQRRKMLDKVARTMETIFHYSLNEQNPPFKKQMKQLVRRTLATAVGYVKLGYQRAMIKRPEDVEKVTDISQQIVVIERILADVADGECEPERAELEQLRVTLAAVQAAPEIIVSEGLVYDFPRSTSIIVDKNCTQLSGFVGAQWVAQEFVLTKDDVKEIYRVDLKCGSEAGHYLPYTETGKADGDTKEGRVCVWEVYHKTDGLLYVVADGYKDFLAEPAAPPVRLSRFWPLFVLCFNESENEGNIFPMSDVELLEPMQREYNRARQGLREHRHANRPMTLAGKGQLDEDDKAKLASHEANAVIELNALVQGQKVSDVLQAFQGPTIDPALYDTTHLFEDVQRVGGSSEANLGGTTGASATEASIAEASRTSALSSNIDDVDDMLNELTRASGQVLLEELSQQTAMLIAGPGAVWPELSGADIAHEIALEIEAGSSGRPNKAAELQNWERIVPLLIQIPGVSPEWLAKQTIMRLDDRLDIADALSDGLQSIVAMNSQKQLATGDPATDPNAQGAQGANNAPAGPAGPAPLQQNAGAQAGLPQ